MHMYVYMYMYMYMCVCVNTFIYMYVCVLREGRKAAAANSRRKWVTDYINK